MPRQGSDWPVVVPALMATLVAPVRAQPDGSLEGFDIAVVTLRRLLRVLSFVLGRWSVGSVRPTMVSQECQTEEARLGMETRPGLAASRWNRAREGPQPGSCEQHDRLPRSSTRRELIYIYI